MYRIAIVPGDGIGREVIPEAVRVLANTGLPLSFEQVDVGYNVYLKTGVPVHSEAVSRIMENDACLFGATTTPVGIKDYKSAITTLRHELDVYANVRPVKSLPVQGSWENVDLVVVRENTEGLYSGVEYRNEDTAFTVRIITRKASTRIARFAFELATKRKNKVTVVSKANIMRATCGMFLECCRQVAECYPTVEVEEKFIDVTAMNLIQYPENFDVILTTNMFGDILSDEAAALVGGLGILPSANIGKKHALFEPVHGSAPDIAGKRIANPVAAILSAGMMLDYLGEKPWAERVRNSVIQVISEKRCLTPDLGGSAYTNELTNAIIDHL
ncbi:isocitrate/isopropylmalate dehydrogenase family protein [Thermoproteota archaeon]